MDIAAKGPSRKGSGRLFSTKAERVEYRRDRKETSEVHRLNKGRKREVLYMWGASGKMID